MRNPWAIRRALCLCALTSFALAVAGVGLRAQSPNATPDNVQELLYEAHQVNGLTAAGIRPWRVKVNFERYDRSDGLVEAGTYEMLWDGQRKQKSIYISPSFSRVEYGSPGGPVVTGNRGRPPGLLVLIWWMVYDSLPNEKMFARLGMDLRRETANGVEADCLYERSIPSRFRIDPATGELADPKLPASAIPNSYCLDANHLLLSANRTINGFHGKVHASYRNPIQYENRWIAGDFELESGGAQTLKAHVESIRPLNKSDEAEFRIPADAREADLLGVEIGSDDEHPNGVNLGHDSPPSVAMPTRVGISPELATRFLSHTAVPVYPPAAKAAGIYGTIVLAARIGKSGAVKSLRVLSGPEQLRQAARDAVRSWVYRPYLLNGTAIEFDTTVNVVFTLGSKPGQP